MPTVLDLLGIVTSITVAGQMQGVSHVPMLKGERLSLDALNYFLREPLS